MAVFRHDHVVYVSSRTHESALGTAQTVDRALIMGESWTPPTDAAERISDADMFTGMEGASNVWIARTWHPIELVFDVVRPDDLAFALAYFASSEEASEAGGDAHYIVGDLTASARTIYPFTLEIPGGDDQLRYSGCVLTEMELRVYADRAATMRLSGYAASKDTGSGSPSFVSGEPIIAPYGMSVGIGSGPSAATITTDGLDLAGATNLTSIARSVVIRMTNQVTLSDMWQFGDSAPARCERERRQIDVELDIETNDHTYVDYLHAATTKWLQVDWDSGVAVVTTGNYRASIIIPELMPVDAPIEIDGARPRTRLALQSIIDDTSDAGSYDRGQFFVRNNNDVGYCTAP